MAEQPYCPIILSGERISLPFLYTEISARVPGRGHAVHQFALTSHHNLFLLPHEESDRYLGRRKANHNLQL